MDAETRKRLERLEQEVGRLRALVAEPVQPWPGSQPSKVPVPTGLSRPEATPPPSHPATPAPYPASSPATAQGLEARIGTRWLAVAGITLFVVAAGLFLRLAIKSGWIGPAAQIGIGFVLGLAVWGFGFYLDRAQRLGEFAHVLAGGGVAITAFAVFAAHHFPKYQAALGIGLAGDTILLTLVAVGALLDAVLRRAQAQAAVAAGLGTITALLALELTVFSLVLSVLFPLVLLVAAAWRRWPAVLVFAAMGPYLTFAVHAARDVLPGAVFAAAGVLLVGFTALGVRQRGGDEWNAMATATGQAIAWVATWAIGVWAFDSWGMDVAAWWTLALGLAAGALAFVPGIDRASRWTWGGLAIAGLIGFAPLLPWAPAVAFVWAAQLGLVAGLRAVSRRTASTITAAALLFLLLLRLLTRELPLVHDRLDGWGFALIAVLAGIAAMAAAWAMDRSQKGPDATLRSFQLGSALLLGMALCAVLATGPGISLLWGLLAVALVGAGFAARRGDLRVAGLTVFGLTLGRIVLFDLAGVDAIWRVAAFAGVGTLLLVTSWLYVRWARTQEPTPRP